MKDSERRLLEKEMRWLKQQAEEGAFEYGNVSISLVYRAGTIVSINRNIEQTSKPEQDPLHDHRVS